MLEKIKSFFEKRTTKIGMMIVSLIGLFAVSIVSYSIKDDVVDRYSSELISFSDYLSADRKNNLDSYFKSEEMKKTILAKLNVEKEKYHLNDLTTLTYTWGESTHSFVFFKYRNINKTALTEVLVATKEVIISKLESFKVGSYTIDYVEGSAYEIVNSKNKPYLILVAFLFNGILFYSVVLFLNEISPKFAVEDYSCINREENK